MRIKIKRIYEDPSANDGYRILVDRLWPGGMKKDRKVSIGKELLKRGFPNKKIRAIYRFLKNAVLFVDPEMNRNFEEVVRS